jgi:hypothetical protein
MEGDREISTSPPSIRKDYEDDMNKFIQDLTAKLSAVSCEFETLITDQNLGDALRRFLGVRNKGK